MLRLCSLGRRKLPCGLFLPLSFLGLLLDTLTLFSLPLSINFCLPLCLCKLVRTELVQLNLQQLSFLKGKTIQLIGLFSVFLFQVDCLSLLKGLQHATIGFRT